MATKINKSQKFRELYDKGYNISQIAKETNEYYSFVHRVIRKYERDQNINIPSIDTDNNKANKKQIEELHKQNYTVDQILEELKLPEDQRSYVYSTVRNLKRKEKSNV